MTDENNSQQLDRADTRVRYDEGNFRRTTRFNRPNKVWGFGHTSSSCWPHSYIGRFYFA